MNYVRKLNITDSFYSAAYDYALDIVGRIIDSKSWYYDQQLGVFTYRFFVKNSPYDKILKLENDRRDIRMPVREINDYFSYQNILEILKSAFEDFGFKVYIDSEDFYNITISENSLKKTLAKYFAVKQCTKHKYPEMVREIHIFTLIDFLINSNCWKKDFMKDILYMNYDLVQVDDDMYVCTFKVFDRINNTFKSLKIDMTKDYYNKFIFELKRRLKLYGVDIFATNKELCLSTLDLNSVRNNFESYYQLKTSLTKKRNW